MKFKIGQKFKVIDDVIFDKGDTVVLCGDLKSTAPKFKSLSTGEIRNCFYTRLRLIEIEVTMKDAKFGIQYMRSEDPVEFFKTKKEAQKRIEELLDDSEVDKKSLFLFEVGRKWKVNRPVSFDLLEI